MGEVATFWGDVPWLGSRRGTPAFSALAGNYAEAGHTPPVRYQRFWGDLLLSDMWTLPFHVPLPEIINFCGTFRSFQVSESNSP